jgi:hypothetical protein
MKHYNQYKKLANDLQIPLAMIFAVDEIESNGNGFTENGKPVVLFERHHFLKHIKNPTDKALCQKLYPSICNRKSGGYTLNEWERLQKACEIDEEAAYKSASWGLFQILGSNYKTCGFDTVYDFVNAMKESESQQIEAFKNFIVNNNLVQYLQTLNFRAFARRYNGIYYYRGKYHTKLRKAYNKYERMVEEDDLIAFDVLIIQKSLRMLGYDVGVLDGIYGKNTAKGIRAFQKDHGINPASGRISKKLVEKLEEAVDGQ